MSRGQQKPIQVKVSTSKVIKALEDSLSKLEANYSQQEINEAKYEKALEEHKKLVFAYCLKHVDKAINLRVNHRSWQGQVNVDFDLPVQDGDLPKTPEKDYVSINEHAYKEQKEEIENAIRILKMTDDEVVNTSTFNAISRYL